MLFVDNNDNRNKTKITNFMSGGGFGAVKFIINDYRWGVYTRGPTNKFQWRRIRLSTPNSSPHTPPLTQILHQHSLFDKCCHTRRVASWFFYIYFVKLKNMWRYTFSQMGPTASTMGRGVKNTKLVWRSLWMMP